MADRFTVEVIFKVTADDDQKFYSEQTSKTKNLSKDSLDFCQVSMLELLKKWKEAS